MSGTRKAVGRAVEFVVKESAMRNQGRVGAWMTVAQVAEAVEISKQSARKYLKALVEAGVVTCHVAEGEFLPTQYYKFNLEDGAK